jgi:hypothetical protein
MFNTLTLTMLHRSVTAAADLPIAFVKASLSA